MNGSFKRILFVVICICFVLSSCGPQGVRVLTYGNVESLTENITFKINNNTANQRFEIEYVFSGSDEGWFSFEMCSEIADESGWSSSASSSAISPFVITDINGNEIAFQNGILKFNKNMTFFVSYANAPEQMKQYCSAFPDTTETENDFSIYVNGYFVVK